MAKITEGYMPFHGYQTYYRIVGEQKDNGNLTWMDIRRCGHRIFGWMNWMH